MMTELTANFGQAYRFKRMKVPLTLMEEGRDAVYTYLVIRIIKIIMQTLATITLLMRVVFQQSLPSYGKKSLQW